VTKGQGVISFNYKTKRDGHPDWHQQCSRSSRSGVHQNVGYADRRTVHRRVVPERHRRVAVWKDAYGQGYTGQEGISRRSLDIDESCKIGVIVLEA